VFNELDILPVRHWWLVNSQSVRDVKTIVITGSEQGTNPQNRRIAARQHTMCMEELRILQALGKFKNVISMTLFVA
jgi:hypothetical protein